MLTDRLPSTPDEIDTDWLTTELQARYPGAKVASIDVIDRTEVTNSHARLRVSYDEPAGAPAAIFAKMPPLDPARRDSINRTGMGRREARFYAELAPSLSLRVPVPHVARYDDRDGTFILLLEDLVESGATVSDGTWGVPVDAAAVALEELAELHARFEDPARRAADAPWVPAAATQGSAYGATMLQYGLDHHRDRLSDDFAAIARIYIDNSAALHGLWTSGPATVIHGDPHIGNLFDDNGHTGFLDWGIINVNTAMRDVSYFLNMGLDIEARRAHQNDLLRHYLDARQAWGAAPITFDDAWRAHRLHAAYTVPASCQVVTFPDNATPRRRVFAAAFLARAEAALADLEARRALADAGV